MTTPRPFIEPGGTSYKFLVCCPSPDGLQLVCVVVPFPPGAEPHSDVLEATAFARIVSVGQVLPVDGLDSQGRPPRAGVPVAFVVQPGMPAVLGRVGDVATLPVFLGVGWPRK